MSLLRLGFIGVAGLGAAGCFDNPNTVGSIGAGGGDNPIVVGGAGGAAAGNTSGGFGNGPGSSGGTNTGATAAVTCRANNQQILLSKGCQGADDCMLISGSGSIIVPGIVSTDCTTLSVGISRVEEARFVAFSAPSNCPPPVGGCAPGELKVQTEDGRVVPASSVVSAQCDAGICSSHAP